MTKISDNEALSFFENNSTLTMAEIYEICKKQNLNYETDVRPTFENLKIHTRQLDFEDKSPNTMESKFILLDKGVSNMLKALEIKEKKSNLGILSLDKIMKCVQITGVILSIGLLCYSIYKVNTIEELIELIPKQLK